VVIAIIDRENRHFIIKIINHKSSKFIIIIILKHVPFGQNIYSDEFSNYVHQKGKKRASHVWEIYDIFTIM